ncbi:hypothetical protein AB0953_06550 [Streptomyces sp. NPDC046866]|uniref:hypothetical protein n=1 Tax=Streptomyces sp. NPDC046866 TaxID=3154921 RepID=UPI0034544399
MSARTAAARRPLRTAAATAVVTAVAGTVLMPLSAYAAPAAENLHALKVTLGAPAPSGPLTRGGATETFELTVDNPTDKVHSFHPWLNGSWVGGNPIQANDVVFKVEPVNAPATDSSVRQMDGEWQGLFTPAGKSTTEGFEVPAGGKLVWKVTVGLAKSYPTNDGDFTLHASSFQNELAPGGQASVTFKTDTVGKPAALETWFDKVNPCQGIDELQCREMDLRYRASGDGEFNTALATYLNAGIESGAGDPDLQLQVLESGTWKDLKPTKDGQGSFRLADIPAPFGKASGERTVHLRAKVGPKAQLKKAGTVTLTADVSLAEGNTTPFVHGDAKFQFGPVTTASPSPSPSASTSASPSPTASAGTSAGTGTSTSTGTTSGSLATTGADSNTGLYSAAAALLVAAGGAFVWLGARRRKAATRG